MVFLNEDLRMEMKIGDESINCLDQWKHRWVIESRWRAKKTTNSTRLTDWAVVGNRDWHKSVIEIVSWSWKFVIDLRLTRSSSTIQRLLIPHQNLTMNKSLSIHPYRIQAIGAKIGGTLLFSYSSIYYKEFHSAWLHPFHWLFSPMARVGLNKRHSPLPFGHLVWNFSGRPLSMPSFWNDLVDEKHGSFQYNMPSDSWWSSFPTIFTISSLHPPCRQPVVIHVRFQSLKRILIVFRLDIYFLTAIFFGLSFLAATQDICVDGWALSMLSR